MLRPQQTGVGEPDKGKRKIFKEIADKRFPNLIRVRNPLTKLKEPHTRQTQGKPN